MVMKPLTTRAACAALAAALASCATTPRDRSADFARALVGQWEYEHDDPECPGHSSEAYRANGTYTATSSNCHLESDSFHFHYGWYVAREHLCIVNIEEQHSDLVKRPRFYRDRFLALSRNGFVEDRCHEKFQSVSARTITLTDRNGRTTTMKRRRWL
jgi:hypothetical protein